MGKYLLYAGILMAALGVGGETTEGHLFEYHRKGGLRAEIGRQYGEDWEGVVYKRLGEKKYLIRQGGCVVMLDTECLATERVVSRELIERIELEATKNLWKMQETEDVGEKRQEN